MLEPPPQLRELSSWKFLPDRVIVLLTTFVVCTPMIIILKTWPPALFDLQ
jgi:hypothetical protein